MGKHTVTQRDLKLCFQTPFGLYSFNGVEDGQTAVSAFQQEILDATQN